MMLDIVGVGGFEPPIPVALLELILIELCESGVLDQLDHTPADGNQCFFGGVIKSDRGLPSLFLDAECPIFQS